MSKLTSEDIRLAIQEIKKSAKPTVPCPKCGKPTYQMSVSSPEIARDLEEIGYDGSCCFEFFPQKEKD